MTESRESDARTDRVEPVVAIPSRGRGAVAASILAVLLIGSYFAAAPGGLRTPTGTFLLNAVIIAVAFWFPAMRVGSMGDVARQWKGLLAWALAWTFAWDTATSGILLGDEPRQWFQDWWLVYPVGVLVLALLLLLHGAVMDWTRRRRGGVGSGI